MREQLKSRHETVIRSFIESLERKTELPDANRNKLIALLTTEIEPCRIEGQYSRYHLLLQLRRIPEKKCKSLLNDDQWQLLNLYCDQSERWEPILREAGILPDRDAER